MALASHYQTEWVPEYARDHFKDQDINHYTAEDLVTIAKKQMALENEKILTARKFLFCDTTLITLKIWAELEFSDVPPLILNNLKTIRYDHYLLTDNTIPWTSDPLRQNKHHRDLIFRINETELKHLKVPYDVIRGSGEERTKHAIAIIDAFF